MVAASDADLIARVLGNDDRRAYGELVRRYQSPLRSLCRRLTGGDAARADDLAQDAFVQAYLKLGTFRGEAKFSTWLLRIAYHLYLAGRRRQHRREASNPDMTPAAPAGRSGAAQLDLERAFLGLTPHERAAIALSFSWGFSHREVAGIMECPVGTVKTHILRGKEKLRLHLAAWEGRVQDG